MHLWAAWLPYLRGRGRKVIPGNNGEKWNLRGKCLCEGNRILRKRRSIASQRGGRLILRKWRCARCEQGLDFLCRATVLIFKSLEGDQLPVFSRRTKMCLPFLSSLPFHPFPYVLLTFLFFFFFSLLTFHGRIVPYTVVGIF